MTTLSFFTKSMQGPDLGPASRQPALRDPIKSTIDSRLDESDGLFINYGMFKDSLPFTMQDNYDGPVKQQNFRAATLENNHLKATFVLDLGGRLWSLYDKDAKRDLITDNPEFRPNNLAIRNAWFAGGIEYNIGRRGHDEQTCSPRFVATLEDTDGTPVIRFYEFDRTRAVPFQIDFYLPDDSRFLLARMRIHNIHDHVIPMYWWSNIAVPMVKGERIVVPTDSTYENCYDGGSHFITKIKLPDGDGFDGTYPENFPAVKDYFFNIPDNQRKFETVMFPDGYGLLFASTSRLQGRKMFVWGGNQGGRHWQRKLMGDAQDYIEIQGGIAKTQQECLPMPPNTAWEWLEAYGPVDAPPSQIFGDWHTAVSAVSNAVDQALPADFLEAELVRTKTAFALKPGNIVCTGAGWGALEEMRLGQRLAAHLDFGQPQAEQADWTALLKNGTMPADCPPSGFIVQDEWQPLLANAKVDNWKTMYHRALHAFHTGDFGTAGKLLEAALPKSMGSYVQFALANVHRMQNNPKLAQIAMMDIISQNTDDISMAKECLKVMVAMDDNPALMLEMAEALPENFRQRPMLQFCRAYALAHCGRLHDALDIITADGGLEIPDIREGESSISSLYIYIMQKLAEADGRAIDAKDIHVPFKLDLRMKI